MAAPRTYALLCLWAVALAQPEADFVTRSDNPNDECRWETALPGAVLGGDPFTVVVEHTPAPYGGVREWLLLMGQDDMGGNHWLWEGTGSAINFGVYGGESILQGDYITASQFIAQVYDGTDIKMYVDGQLAEQLAAPSMNIQTNELKIGVKPPNWQHEGDYSGCIYKASFFRRALTDDEVWALFYPSPSGCSSASTRAAKLGDSAWACEGTWETPGVASGAASLCGPGYGLCSLEGIDSAGVTQQECLGVPGFYAAGVSSDGFHQCRTDGGGADDFWGCGTVSHGTTPCRALARVMGHHLPGTLAGWVFPDVEHEFTTAYFAGGDGQHGGVMCCPTETTTATTETTPGNATTTAPREQPARISPGDAVEVKCTSETEYHPALVHNVSATGIVAVYALLGHTYYCTPADWRIPVAGNHEDACAPHGGILPPWGGHKCCPATCGVCGMEGCHLLPGGRSSCCTRRIPDSRLCGEHGQGAPCALAPSLPSPTSRRLRGPGAAAVEEQEQEALLVEEALAEGLL